MPLSEFPKGQRVTTHPATDAWMRGDRYGVVVEINETDLLPSRLEVQVLLDKSGRKVFFDADLLTPLRD